MHVIDRDSYSSPNRSSRHGRAISMLVLHATADSNVKSSLNWLSSPASQVSAHYVIDKIGAIWQLVPDAAAAWHAGKSAWLGLASDDIQAVSIGIELENRNTGRDPYPEQQVAALTWLARGLIDTYRIAPDMVVRHLDIAIPKGRKTDPRGFPWDLWKAQLFAPGGTYRVIGLPVYQRRDRTGPLADILTSGDQVEIDVRYSDGGGHLKSGAGFVDMNGLVRE